MKRFIFALGGVTIFAGSFLTSSETEDNLARIHYPTFDWE